MDFNRIIFTPLRINKAKIEFDHRSYRLQNWRKKILKHTKYFWRRGPVDISLTWTSISITLIKSASLKIKFSWQLSTVDVAIKVIKSADFYPHNYMANTKPFCCFSIYKHIFSLFLYNHHPFFGLPFLYVNMVWSNCNMHILCFRTSFWFLD